MRSDPVCTLCHGTVKRNNDSKWLLTIRNQEDLDSYLNLDRLLLIIEEYPRFYEHNFDDISIRAFEINPKQTPMFRSLLRSYYHDIFLKSKSKVPAPKNLWPYSYQFYMCDPVEIFHCTVYDFLSKPRVCIEKYIEPNEARSDVVQMPLSILNTNEKMQLLDSTGLYVSPFDKSGLSLRD